MKEKYLTSQQVTKALNVAPITTQRWLKSGKIPSIKINAGTGTRYRIKESDLENFISKMGPFLKINGR